MAKMMASLFCFIFAGLPAMASLSGPMSVTGVVTSFDSKEVVIRVKSRKVKVPKGSIQDRDFKVGESVLVELSQAEFSKAFSVPKARLPKNAR